MSAPHGHDASLPCDITCQPPRGAVLDETQAALAAMDEFATAHGETATDPDGQPRDLGERIRALTARGVRDVGARLLPDRETLVREFEAADVVRGDRDDEWHTPDTVEAERMADVALAAVGGPEGTAPAGEEVGAPFRDRLHAQVMEAHARVFAPEDAEEPEFRDDLADAVMAVVWPRIQNGERLHRLDAGVIGRLRGQLAAPSRSGRPDPGEDERDDERRFGLGAALGWEMEGYTPSWRQVARGIADLRALTEGADTGRDQAHVALADQWRLDADNLRNAELPKSSLLTIAEHLDQAARIVGGERP